MAKAVREIKDSLKLIDIALIILDARVPYSSINPDVLELVKNKTTIMVLNKKDLADNQKLKEAEEKFKKDGFYTVRIDSINGEGINELVNLIEKLGEKIKNTSRTSIAYKGVNEVYRALVIGLPNVGKSSLINKLSKKKSLEVGDRPGVTKFKQWIKVSKNIEIMDTPGIMVKSFKEEKSAEKLAIAGTIKEEILDFELLSFTLINILMANDLYQAMLKNRYKLSDNILSFTENEILEEIGKKRGILTLGGLVDTERTAKVLIDDYRKGKIGKINLE